MGANSDRPTKSASTTIAPPITAAVGINRSWDDPTSILSRCGAIKPTKVIASFFQLLSILPCSSIGLTPDFWLLANDKYF